MTPTRYRECLDTLGMSQRGLAPILRCSDRLPRAWATGREIIPSEVAQWLEAWVAIRLAHPDPSPPENWSRWRSPTATVGKAARTELPPGHCEINLPTENTTLNDEQPRPVLTSLEGNAQRDDASQIAAQDRSPSMTARNISDVLTEVTAKLEQFGRLTAELATVCARADDDEKRVAHLIITSFVRPAVTSLLRALNRDVN